MFDLGVGEADAGAAAEGDDYDEDDHQAGKQDEGAVDFMDEDELIEDDLGNFFHYAGSLTTPPFTEAVEWVVEKTIVFDPGSNR